MERKSTPVSPFNFEQLVRRDHAAAILKTIRKWRVIQTTGHFDSALPLPTPPNQAALTGVTSHFINFHT